MSTASAALLFLVVMAAAKGVRPDLSLAVRSSPDAAADSSSSEIRELCAFSMEMWSGVLPSASF